ncbi:MAG: hypothetical protein PWQ61_2120 [Betaproteobacteria bacterium]|nr:hypothetical protein [Betaproteobacteria bacterium]
MVVDTSLCPSSSCTVRMSVPACLQQVRGKRMPQGVHRHVLGNAGLLHRQLQPARELFFKQVMPSDGAGDRVGGVLGCGEHPEPGPGLAGPGVLALQCMRQVDTALSGRPVLRPQGPRLHQLFLQAGHQRAWQHHHPVLVALAAAHQVQHLPHLFRTQHCGHPLALGRAANVLHPRQLHAQHLPVQKQQGIEGLAVGGWGHPPLGGQHRQKTLHLGLPQQARVPKALTALSCCPQHKGLGPVDVGLLRL